MPLDDLYGRTGLSGRAGLSRLEKLMSTGAVHPGEASSMLDTMRQQSDLTSFLPRPSGPAAGMAGSSSRVPGPQAPGGLPGHGTILAQLMQSLMASNGVAPPSPQYQAGRALGELVNRRRG